MPTATAAMVTGAPPLDAARTLLAAFARHPHRAVDSSASDEELMLAYLDGDRDAFRLLFRRLAPRLRAFFHRSFRSSTVADDLLQTTFLKLHRSRDRFDRGARVLPWVFTIAARVRVDELRRRYRVAERLGDDDAPVEAAAPAVAEGALLHDERAERVRRAVDGLPEGQRVVVHLHRFEGLTFGEVARVLDLKEGAVRLRAFRAYARLRAALGDLVDAADGEAVEAGAPEAGVVDVRAVDEGGSR